MFQILLFLLFNIVGVAQKVSYDSLILKVNELESIKAYVQARSLLLQNLPDYGEKWFELSKELIYLNEQTNQTEKNLSVFEEAHQKGNFYTIHPMMKEYKAYLDFSWFDRISKADLQLRAEANEKSTTKFEIQLPENYQQHKNYPLVLIFHGGGKSMDDAKQHWNGPFVNQNFIKVYLQSYRHFDSKSYGWGNQDERLDKEIKVITSEIITKYKVDSLMLFACGISAGAGAAIDLSLRNIIPVKGILAICPTIPKMLNENQFDLVLNKSVKVDIVSGEHDHFLEQQKQMTRIFDQLNITYKHFIVEGIGHQYPEDENKYFEYFINSMNINL